MKLNVEKIDLIKYALRAGIQNEITLMDAGHFSGRKEKFENLLKELEEKDVNWKYVGNYYITSDRCPDNCDYLRRNATGKWCPTCEYFERGNFAHLNEREN